MVQFYNLLNTLSKNMSISPGKKSRSSNEWEAAIALGKEAKKNELLRTSSGSVNGRNSESFAAGHSKRGKKGPVNQDCFVIWEEFGCQEDSIFCGVFDGHGPWGHLLSKTVRELMPSSFLCHWQEADALNPEDSDHSLEFSLYQRQEKFDIWKQSYYKACASVDQELEHYPGIDSFYSGSTALALVRQGDLLTIANVGDSRAVLATVSDDGFLVATQLTTDLKPSVPGERKRITESRGVVYSCPDEPEVHRVWMPNGKTIRGPGLAVSRAFGDYYIKDFGLISEPEIIQTNISSRDQFVILATDGVWDVLSNQEAVEIVASTERGESAKRLVECAVCAWKQRGRSGVMDDISAVCLFFHCSISPDRAFEETKLNKKRV